MKVDLLAWGLLGRCWSQKSWPASLGGEGALGGVLEAQAGLQADLGLGRASAAAAAAFKAFRASSAAPRQVKGRVQGRAPPEEPSGDLGWVSDAVEDLRLLSDEEQERQLGPHSRMVQPGLLALARGSLDNPPCSAFKLVMGAPLWIVCSMRPPRNIYQDVKNICKIRLLEEHGNLPFLQLPKVTSRKEEPGPSFEWGWLRQKPGPAAISCLRLFGLLLDMVVVLEVSKPSRQQLAGTEDVLLPLAIPPLQHVNIKISPGGAMKNFLRVSLRNGCSRKFYCSKARICLEVVSSLRCLVVYLGGTQRGE
ncbi:hypothetical protein E2320_000247, partial [Naja naja]